MATVSIVKVPSMPSPASAVEMAVKEEGFHLQRTPRSVKGQNNVEFNACVCLEKFCVHGKGPMLMTSV